MLDIRSYMGKEQPERFQVLSQVREEGVMREVIVHWRDTCSNAHSNTPEEIEDETIFDTWTMGYLFGEDDVEDWDFRQAKEITIVQTCFYRRGELIYGTHIFTIPKISILFIEEVAKKKIVYRHP